MALYIDGNLTGTTQITLNPPINNESMTIGCFYNSSPTWGYRVFNGTIDSVRIWNRALNQTEIQAEMNSVRPVIRPVAAWEFDEGSGTVANDTHIWTGGQFNSGLSFDGLDDYVSIPDATNQRGMTALTISAWVNARAWTPTYYGFVSKYSAATKRFYLLGYPSSGLIWFYAGDGSTVQSITTAQPSLNQWHHYVGVFNGGQYMKIFLDGAEVNSSSTALLNISNAAGETLYIGRYSTYNSTASIDDVAIFNRSLTATEISKLYSNGNTLGDVPRIAAYAYVNATGSLAPGSTYTLNFSSLGNATNIASIPLGTYILRVSSYSQTRAGFTDRTFTCT
jgi:hypothetical protein